VPTFASEPWLLYGATGRTGTLIAEEAAARGHRPVLAGRDRDRLRDLAERLELPWVVGETVDIRRMVDDVQLVLLTASPFETTAPPVLRACLDAGVHYLDIANDIAVATATLAARDEARERGITALPAVGFGTVASDGLACYVTEQLPDAIDLELAILAGTDGSSPGARASNMSALARGGRIRRGGRLVRTRLGAQARRQQTPMGARTFVPVPTADLVVSAHTTGIQNITASRAVPLPSPVAKLVMPALPVVARAAGKLARRDRQPQPTAGANTPDGYVWAKATTADGRNAQCWLRTGEGYAYTARAAVLAVEATLRAEPLGATTVARAFGSDLSFRAGSELVAAT